MLKNIEFVLRPFYEATKLNSSRKYLSVKYKRSVIFRLLPDSFETLYSFLRQLSAYILVSKMIPQHMICCVSIVNSEKSLR